MLWTKRGRKERRNEPIVEKLGLGLEQVRESGAQVAGGEHQIRADGGRRRLTQQKEEQLKVLLAERLAEMSRH